MLINMALNRDSMCKVAIDPLIRILFRPSRKMVLLINNSPSKGKPSSDNISVNNWFCGKEKRASTLASLHPLRIRSADALPPRIKFIAFIMIDFPAPVSPERILSPALSVISRCLIMAKLPNCFGMAFGSQLMLLMLRAWKKTVRSSQTTDVL